MSELSAASNTGMSAGVLGPRVVRGGLWVALASYLSIGFGFVANLGLTRILGPEAFGVIALAGFVSSLINLRPKSGLNQAFAQRPEMSGALVGTHLALDVGSGVLTVALSAAAVPVLRALGYAPSVGWAVVALAGVGVLDSVMGTAWVLLDRELHFRDSSLITLVAFPLSYLPAFWLALHGAGYWSLLAQTATYSLLLLLGMWWMARRRLPHVFRLEWRFDGQVARSLLRFGVVVGTATMAGLFLAQFDNFLVGTFVGLTVLGFYDRAYRIAQWPTVLVSGVVNRTAFYTYARVHDDPARLLKSVTMALWVITSLALPLALAIFATAPDLVALLYGPKWLPAAPFVRFLVVFSLLRPVLDLMGSLFVAVGRPKRATAVSGLQAVALAVVATPLTLLRGAVGTCIGVGVAFGIGLVAAYRYLRRTVDLSLYSALAAPAASAALALAAYWLMGRGGTIAALPLVVRVVAKGGLVAGVFVAAMLAFAWRTTLERVRYVWQQLQPGR
jgi:O-antigen/teichoic acid export membrane protein